MKIKELRIIGFGKWQAKTISLAPDFQLIYGHNEAGKSTMIQFIQTILFGFPTKRSQSKDYTPNNQSLYGGSLLIEHPRSGLVEIERIQTKNRGKATVRFADGQMGTEEQLQELLLPLTAELFTEVFSLQQEQLIGINELAEDQLQQLLLAIGVSGSQKILDKQTKFYKKQQELYKPTGRLPELNQKLTAYQELKATISRKEQGEARYQEQRQTVSKMTEELKGAQQELESKNDKLARLQEQVQLYPLVEQRQQLVQQLATQDGILPAEKIATLEESHRHYQLLTEQEVHYQELKKQQLLTSQASPAYLFFNEYEERIKASVQQQTEVETLLAKQQWLEEGNGKALLERQRLASELALTVEPKNVLPTDKVKQELTALATQEQHLLTTLQQQEQAFDQLLDLQEEQGDGQSGKRSRQSVVPKSFKLAASVSLIIGLTLLLRKTWLIGSFFMLVGIVAWGWLMGRGQPITRKAETRLKATDQAELDDLAEKIAHSQEQLKGLALEKDYYVAYYGFSERAAVSDWLYQWPLRQRLAELLTTTMATESELQRNQQQLAKYRQELTFMKEWLPVESAELSQLYLKLAAFQEEMLVKRVTTNQTEQGLDSWQEPLLDTQQRKGQLMVKLSHNYPELGIQRLSELPMVLAKQQDLLEASQKVTQLTAKLAPIFNLQKNYQLPELKAELASSLAAKKATITMIADYQQQLQELTFSLRQQEVDGTLSELYQQQAGLQEELVNLSHLWLENRLSMTVLQDVLDVLATQQLPALLSTATAFFNKLTKGSYQKCLLQEKKLVVSKPNGEIYPLSQLSTGTRDQLYMAIRLAFIQLHSQEQLAPVIIDDGWLHYDAQRKLALFDLLTVMSQDVQVLCFTSDVELNNYVTQTKFNCIEL